MPVTSTLFYLTGFMAAGKSTVGKLFAREMGYLFLDLDAHIAEMTGKPIPEIFEQEGEERFRELEAQALRKTGGYEKAVIATGGGTPCFHGGMDWMNRHGITIYLQLPASTLLERLKRVERSGRPLLGQKSEEELYDWIEDQLNEREPVYRKARICLAADQPPAVICKVLKKEWKKL